MDTKQNEAHMIILNTDDAKQLSDQVSRLTDLFWTTFYRRKILMCAPSDAQPAKVLPLRSARAATDSLLDETF